MGAARVLMGAARVLMGAARVPQGPDDPWVPPHDQGSQPHQCRPTAVGGRAAESVGARGSVEPTVPTSTSESNSTCSRIIIIILGLLSLAKAGLRRPDS